MYGDCVEGKWFEEEDGVKVRKWIKQHGDIWKIHWVENGIENTYKGGLNSELLAREELMYGTGRLVKADKYIE